MADYRLDPANSGQCQMAGFFKYGNDGMVTFKWRKYID